MSRHPRGRRHIVATRLKKSVEFAELLDPIRTTSISENSAESGTVDADMAFADTLVADMLVANPEATDVVTSPDTEPEPEPETQPEPEPELVLEPVVEPIPVSRFADVGIDDDRLPLQAPTKRFRLR